MGEYTEDSILTSEKAYRILSKIAEKESGSYATEIAKETDIDRSMASEIVNRFRDKGLLQEGKRTRAQYYEVDYEAFFSVFIDILEDKVDSSESFRKIQEDDEISSEVQTFVEKYVQLYLEKVSDSNIQKMLYDDFFKGLKNNYRVLDDEDRDDWMAALMKARNWDKQDLIPQALVRWTLEDLK